MSTPILKVLTEYCAVYVDDENLSELSVTDAPLYARRMWGYFLPAISLFTHPPEMEDYLVFADEPSYADAIYTTTTEYAADFVVALGAAYAGFDLCACRVKTVDAGGHVIMTPIAVTYDATTGDVTVSVSGTIPSGTVLTFDFYTDGAFANTLDMQTCNILGYCFQIVWQDRFNTDWLSMVSKIEDKSFKEQNRAKKIEADTARLKALYAKLDAAMQTYETKKYYKKIITQAQRLQI